MQPKSQFGMGLWIISSSNVLLPPCKLKFCEYASFVLVVYDKLIRVLAHDYSHKFSSEVNVKCYGEILKTHKGIRCGYKLWPVPEFDDCK